jgi:hypothetical protein
MTSKKSSPLDQEWKPMKKKQFFKPVWVGISP